MLVALLAVTLVASVPALALQAVVAVRVVRATGDGQRRVTASAAGLGLATGAAMLALGLAAAPVFERFLDLAGPMEAVWVAVAVGVTTVLAVLQGVAQGRQDFHRLALILVVYAAARLAGGLAGLLVFDSVASGDWQVRELLVACQALAGLYLLTNLDPVLARHYLPATEAGLYGAGAVLAKAAFFLPQAVVLVLFPRLASSPRPGRTLWLGLGALTGLGLLMTGVTRLAGGLAVTAVGGDAYRELASHAYLFVAVGSALGVVQLLLYARLTTDRAHATIAVWAVVAGEAAVVATVAHGSLAEVVGAALGTALLAAVLGLAWTARGVSSARASAAADPATSTPRRRRPR